MISYLTRAVAVTLGVACLLLGVVGLFLPVLQGVLLILVGVSLISVASERAAGLVRGLLRRAEEMVQRRGWDDTLGGRLLRRLRRRTSRDQTG